MNIHILSLLFLNNFLILVHGLHSNIANTPINKNEIVEKQSCTEGELSPDPTDCTSYYVCNHGKQVKRQCGPGTHFSPKNKNCDWPENAGCVEESSTQRTTGQPTEETEEPTTTEQPTEETEEPETTTTTQTTRRTRSTRSTRSTSTEQPINQSNYKKICYFTNWAWYRPEGGKYLPKDIDPSLCTHIVYSFALLDASTYTIKPSDTWADIDNKFFEQVTKLKSKRTKVTIAIGGWNDSAGDKYSKMIETRERRGNFIKSVQKFIDDYNFDGIDLDWEYPGCWQGDCNRGPPADKQNFLNLVKELREAMPGKIISAAVSAAQPKINKGYDVPQLSKYLDWIGVMDYDFRGSWDGKTGHHASLYASADESDQTFNVASSIDYWISKGADRKKLIVGMPTYGQSFALSNEKNNGMNAPTSGGGQAGEFTRSSGFLAYYEICKDTSWTVVKDSRAKRGPYAYKGNQWVSYDDASILEVKVKYVKRERLGGAMVWALDLDDFKNTCGMGKYPLISAISKNLN